MASLDSLPADRRAVLALVLQRGRSYDDIAQMLSIDRAAVRERALSALDALGPQTGVPPESRALITDYLLGQLPDRVAETVRGRLAESPAERAWARVVASELAPLASEPLPEIPAAGAARPVPGDAAPAPAAPEQPPASPAPATPAPAARASAAPEPPEPAARPPRPSGPSGGPQDRPASRRGGAILLSITALAVVVAIVIILLVSGGSSSKRHTSSTAATTSTATSSTATGTARPIAQVNLTSPTGSKHIGGVAIVVKQGASTGLVIRAQGVPANTKHDAYAVWLYNSPSDDHILGFVSPGVASNGVLQTAGLLPSNASHYKQLLVSLETTGKPKAPAKIVLQGPLSLSG